MRTEGGRRGGRRGREGKAKSVVVFVSVVIGCACKYVQAHSTFDVHS